MIIFLLIVRFSRVLGMISSYSLPISGFSGVSGTITPIRYRFQDSLEFWARLLPIRYRFQDSLEFRARLSSIRYRFQDSLEFWARLIPV